MAINSINSTSSFNNINMIGHGMAFINKKNDPSRLINISKGKDKENNINNGNNNYCNNCSSVRTRIGSGIRSSFSKQSNCSRENTNGNNNVNAGTNKNNNNCVMIKISGLKNENNTIATTSKTSTNFGERNNGNSNVNTNGKDTNGGVINNNSSSLGNSKATNNNSIITNKELM